MERSNRYAKRSKLSEAKVRELVRLFAVDLNSTQIAYITGLNINTVDRYLHGIRHRIAEACEEQTPFRGEVEIDESYFGGRRKGQRGRGAAGKMIVFGLLKRQGKVYTQLIPNVTRKTLQAIISGRVDVDSVIHTDGFAGYDGLVDLGYKKHYRVRHGQGEFANELSHINGIESFWGFAKARLSKFQGIPRNTFYLHLKECEFRFNNRQTELYPLLLKSLRKNPLF